MLETYCAASNLRVGLELPGCPSILKRCLGIIQKRLGQELRGTLMSDIFTLGAKTDTTLPAGGQRVDLDPDIRVALAERLTSEGSPSLKTSEAHSYATYKINGLRYAERNIAEGNSIIFFRPTGAQDLVPAVIRRIFAFPSEDASIPQVFLAIHRYLPIEESFDDPFKLDSDLGMSLWQSQTDRRVEVIQCSQDICHGNQRPWEKGIVVMRPTHRVSPGVLQRRIRTELKFIRYSKPFGEHASTVYI
jgi:hypothetical protein